MSRGFKGFRKPETVSVEAIKAARELYDNSGRFIYWTGETYNFRAASARSGSLRALTVAERPVRLSDFIEAAGKIVDKDTRLGYPPSVVKAGLYLHRNSKPAVYFELLRDEKGNFLSVNSVPSAGKEGSLKANAIFLKANDPRAEIADIEAKGALIVRKGKGKPTAPIPALAAPTAPTAPTARATAPTKGKTRK